MEISRVWVIGYSGPATKPCKARKPTREGIDWAMPQRNEASTNSSAAAMNRRQPAGQRQGDGVAHGERGDHPGALFRTHPEVTGDGRQGDVGDGGIEHLHESRQGQADGRHHQAGRGEAAAFAHAGGLNAGRSCRGLRRGWLRSGVRSACRPRPVAAGRHRWRTALRAVAAGPGPGRSGRAGRP